MIRKHIAPCEVVHLSSLGTGEGAAGAHALVKEKEFSVLLLHVTTAKSIPEHAVDGPIIVQCLSGNLDFSVESTVQKMRAGDWMYVPGGKPHGVVAQEDGNLLVLRLLA